MPKINTLELAKLMFLAFETDYCTRNTMVDPEQFEEQPESNQKAWRAAACMAIHYAAGRADSINELGRFVGPIESVFDEIRRSAKG